MRVLVVGSGGREHAIAWACEQHGHTVSITAGLGDVTAADVDLVIPGPESVLVAGIADECSFRKIPCFGPDLQTGPDRIVQGIQPTSRHVARCAGPELRTLRGERRRGAHSRGGASSASRSSSNSTGSQPAKA